MVYNSLQILEAVKQERVICVPFDAMHVRDTSLDVTLGHHYYRAERTSDRATYNPFDAEDVARYFGNPLEAISHANWCAENGVTLLKGIPESHPVIPLRPGEHILAHTHEFIGIKPPGACEVKAHSTWAANGIALCFDTSWVDAGHINRLTLEIYNSHQSEIIVLPVGEHVAQVVFHDTGEVPSSYEKGRYTAFRGRDQRGTDLANLIAQWEPSQMLPKAYLGTRTVPTTIQGLTYRPRPLAKVRKHR